MISVLLSSFTNLSTHFETSLASSSLVVTKIADASSSCSACESKSAATYFGLAVSSAKTKISLGPAIESILTKPNTAFFARATKILPGPTILSTFLIDSVP